ncbi:MAG: AAA family ATPase [Candidatus Riflebacteria bacterium]|nr:AAA family ATPase [Candidatus Riflebacteria bacterium]
MVNHNQLKTLFGAFRDQNEATFLQVAEKIIAGELASNNFKEACELRKMIERQNKAMKSTIQPMNLAYLPRDRRNGENLIELQESKISSDKIVFTKETELKINRVLEEFRQRNLLGKYGLTPKRKLLFWGSPGCGKTLTAFFLGYELGLPVGILKLNSVISSFLGDTAGHIQRVFDLAEKTPIVLVLDEIDAIAKNRDDRNDVGELKRVVNSLLQTLDFFKSSQSIVVAASNHQYLLDPAVWRRFDDVIQFPLPEISDITVFLNRFLNGINVDFTFPTVAKFLKGLSFADIEKNLVEALKSMILEGRQILNKEDILSQVKVFKTSLEKAKKK